MTDILKTLALATQRDRVRRAGRSISYNPVLLLPSLAVATFAWLVPTDILERLPWIRAAASQLGIAALLDRTAEVSVFPQVTFAVYFMVALLLAPVSLWAAFHMFRWRGIVPPDGYDFRRGVMPPDGYNFRASRTLGMAVVVFALVGVMVFGVFWLPGDPSSCEGCTTHSRLGLGVLLGLCTYSVPLLTGMGFWRLFAAMERLRAKR